MTPYQDSPIAFNGAASGESSRVARVSYEKLKSYGIVKDRMSIGMPLRVCSSNDREVIRKY